MTFYNQRCFAVLCSGKDILDQILSLLSMPMIRACHVLESEDYFLCNNRSNFLKYQLENFFAKFQQAFSSAYVRLVSPMTFAVRARDGSPHVVEATYRDDLDSLQWYCSCGLRQRCSHIASVMLVL